MTFKNNLNTKQQRDLLEVLKKTQIFRENWKGYSASKKVKAKTVWDERIKAEKKSQNEKEDTWDVEYNTEVLHSDFKGCPETETDILNLLPKQPKYRDRELGKLGALWDKFKWAKHGQILNVSCNSTYLLQVFKNHVQASRVLTLSDKVGLTITVDDKYRFGAEKKEWNYSKKKAFNHHVGKMIDQLCSKFNINPSTNKHRKRASVVQNIDDNLEVKLNNLTDDQKKHLLNTYNIGFSAGMRVPGLTEKTALELLHLKYPQIRDTQKIIDYDNEHFLKDAPEQQCYFQPKVHISTKGYLTNIGGRAYSEMCNYVSASKKRKAGCTQEDIDEYARKNLHPQHKQYKEDYAREYFEKHGIDYYDYNPWDATASIYQIKYFENFGRFFDEDTDEDPYSYMFGSNLKENRNVFKALIPMGATFNWSEKAVYAALSRVGEGKESIPNNAFKQLDKNHPKVLDPLTNKLIEYSRFLVYTIVRRIQEVVQNKKKDTSVFCHESCIYANVAHELRMKGFYVIQIYDEFIVGKQGLGTMDKETFNRQMTELVKRHTKAYFNKYYPDKFNPSQTLNTLHNKSLISMPSVTNVTRHTPLVYNICIQNTSQKVTVMETTKTIQKEPTEKPQSTTKEEPRLITEEKFRETAKWWFEFKC